MATTIASANTSDTNRGVMTTITTTIGSDQMTVNGQTITIDAPAVIVDGRTMIPLRAIAEAFGAEVSWEANVNISRIYPFQIGGFEVQPNINVVSIKYSGLEVVFAQVVGSDFVPVVIAPQFNSASNLDVPPIIANGRTLVPIRVISELFGADVDWNPETRAVTITMSDGQTPTQPPQQNIPVNASSLEQEFMRFLEGFTRELVVGVYSPVQQLEVVYDFIIRNFAYYDERDGAVIDGSRRPPRNIIPQPPNIFEVPVTSFVGGNPVTVTREVIFGVSQPYNLAWELLIRGEGVCSHFTALLNLMANTLGFETGFVTGYFVSANGARSAHAWSAIRIDGTWYYFDAQIEAGQLKRNRNNANWNPRSFWRQPLNAPLAERRYVIDDSWDSFDWVR